MNGLEINEELLQQLGFNNLSAEESAELQMRLFGILQMRIGTRLSEDLTDDQLHELEHKFTPNEHDTPEDEQRKQQAITEWLQQNHPHYGEVVHHEYQALMQDVKANPAILDAPLQ